jgi:hypothetical protein
MKKYFQNRQRELYNAYKASAALGHSVPKGNERELITSQFLTQHMPPVVQASQGILVDQDTLDFKQLNQTNCPQLDLLLVTSNLPQLTFYGGSRIFLAESVAVVIEVKTNLSVAEIERILKHCKKVKERKRQIFGMYWAEPNDPTSGPSEKVPYYVVSFDSSKTAQEIMTLFKKKSSELGLSEEDQKGAFPDGIFILNPEIGTIVLKDIGLHTLKTDLSVPPFFGGEIKHDSLCALWFTLMAQIEASRFLSFPNKTYINKLFPKPENIG